MSRIFVSCAYRDRTVGGQVVDLLRNLGHDAADDRGDANSKRWWREVVRRIEGSDVFVAVASPSYAAAKMCRLEADHAASHDVRMLRLDLADPEDCTVLDECHPAVAGANAVPFDPDDPSAPGLLAYALAMPRPGRGRIDALAAAVVLLTASALLAFALRGGFTGPETGPTMTEPVASAASGAGPADVAQPALLAPSDAAGEQFPGLELPPTSCESGADGTLTCRDPAPNIHTVVLQSYPNRQSLYSAYADAVAGLAGGRAPENTGNCSAYESEGEVGWNRDKLHTRAYPIAEQVLGILDPATETAGRVFCTTSSHVMRLVWTQDPHVLATVSGQPADLVVDWWADVHLRMACVDGATGKGC